MNVVLKRRLLRNRTEARPAIPWWFTATIALLAFVSIVVTAAIGALFILYTTYADGYVPIAQKLKERSLGLTTVYDRGGPESGVLLGTVSNPNGQLLNPVPLEEISHWMIDATVSTEDNTFWDNPGFDPKGILRAAWDNYHGGGVGTAGGGSSITQQLVKNVYLSDDCTFVNDQKVCTAPRTLKRKLKEIVYAIELEQDASKQQILSWYLNQTSYADRYVGVEAAAQGYFHKPARDLTLAEAATLAGIPAAPTDYHPRLNCAKGADGNCVVDEQGRTTLAGAAKTRQEQVLDLMAEHNRASRAEVDAAKAEVIKVYPQTSSLKAAAWIDDQVEPRLVRMCEAGILPLIPGTKNCTDSVHSAGYKVTSTLDWTETQKATAMMNAYVANGLKLGCECHNAAVATIEPSTGQIMVYAPNIDPTWTSDKRVAGNIDQLVEINQPGSSFKPAVYLAWMDKLNKTPLSSIFDTSPMTLDPKTNPSQAGAVVIRDPRADGGNEGLISMRLALGGSQNVPAFRAASEVGIDNVIAYAKALGITTLDQGFDPTFLSHKDIYYGPSIATGGANVRPIDMAYMNATIANMGYMVGVPTLAEEIDPATLHSLTEDGEGHDVALQQKLDFQHGHIRLPGTRPLDPVTVLEVRDIDGKVLYQQGADLQRIEVVNPGSVWMLQSVQMDCTARVIIWVCGSSNDDNQLDTFLPNGQKIPMGIKTGTQQGFTNANDTLSTWMNGYTPYAATAVWVGNADKSNVRDGPSANYASANATIRLFKNWMSQYHVDLQAAGVFTGAPADFSAQRPNNVVFKPFQTATTDRGRRGGCSQMIEGWQRTDVPNLGDCQGKGYMPLPALRPDLAAATARARGIPVGAGASAVAGVPAPGPSPTAQPSPTQATQPTPTQPARTTPTPVPTQATPPPTRTPPAPTPTPTTAPPPTATATPTTGATAPATASASASASGRR